MNRFVSFLLIPMFLLGQALPHSHAGSAVVEPDDHSLRPHFHLAHSHHDDALEHGHQHDAEVVSLAGLGENLHSSNHDHDAIYVAASTFSTNRAVVATQSDWLTMLDLPLPFTMVVGDLRTCSRISDPPDRCSPIPIYLLVASLRL
ncbi:hypothetical protein [Novipirellula artificiosorum]|uniref:hypothetical protein n=1 Tax=Novipirellula artificiosorum TaxID=2528016 RepID=UPI0011B69914|nr:hypothetical protein [Novipirellula artificiosorum]